MLNIQNMLLLNSNTRGKILNGLFYYYFDSLILLEILFKSITIKFNDFFFPDSNVIYSSYLAF